MGQSSSVDTSQFQSKELLTKQQIIEIFYARVLLTLSPADLSLIASKLNVTSLSDSYVITLSDLAFLLQLSNDKDKDVSSIHDEFADAMRILYNSLNVLGNLPFLSTLASAKEGQLTMNRLLVASVVHTGKLKSIWNDYNYLTLIFISLASASCDLNLAPLTEKSSVKSEKGDLPVYPIFWDASDLKSTAEKAKSVAWNEFSSLVDYDGLDVDKLTVSADILVRLVTLLLIVKSVRLQSHKKMQLLLQERIANSWRKFRLAAITLVRYINIEVTPLNLAGQVLSHRQFQQGSSLLYPIFSETFERLFVHGLMGSIVADPKRETPLHPEKKHGSLRHKMYEFQESRLMNDATLTILSIALQNTGISAELSRESVVELYNGSQAGFSIRSLELKVFKWQAPTLFLISGKRLRSKTITNNKRYQQFDAEYPKFFRSTENPIRDWQKEADKITYAVYVNQPWQNSNKANFGDESSALISLLPRFDVFGSKHDPQLKGQLIYFNNLGMGIGFGNDQPINKNNVRKILPGKVSLTVESNLEFAVFRHIRNSSANTLGYFSFSNQERLHYENYEDRFMVTDLEVWGLGSNKELEDQKREWDWEENQAQARQSVNVDTLKEDRAFLEMAGLVGGYNGGGSM